MYIYVVMGHLCTGVIAGALQEIIALRVVRREEGPGEEKRNDTLTG
jgi:mannose/fructose/N-acetylgalactosamine-specific phosphotransferase system component IIC